jgi:phosphoenolpyruvate-protein phosphotransferase (PTS system enzyme I)
MTISIHGIAVSRGISIGRAVVVTSSRADVAHYFIDATQVEAEIERVRTARDAVVEELMRLQRGMSVAEHKDTADELHALLDVHIMLLQDSAMSDGVKQFIVERHYNAEWALTSQLEVISRHFDEMEDAYLRERKGDLEQVVERVLTRMRGGQTVPAPASSAVSELPTGFGQTELELGEFEDVPLVLIAHDLSPADMLQFKSSVFAAFVTDVGGKTSHTAIVARGLDIPAVVGARTASQLVRPDDWVIVDGDAGVLIVDPSPIILDEYRFKRRQAELERSRLQRLKHTSAVTLDGEAVELLANIELPQDAVAACASGAQGVGLFRSEFLFMGRSARGLSQLPDEDEQYFAYKAAVEGMGGLPVTIRTIDVGADKPLDDTPKAAHTNPALGLRAIRWSLAEPAMFLTQLRAILRAAAHGPVRLLIPMVAHVSEARQTRNLIERAKEQLRKRGIDVPDLPVGAMVEIPAAAVMIDTFLKHFDFVSIGTNDLIQYTLAIDRADESVAHLYDPLHPAVLALIARTIERARAAGKDVCVCGEMAGDAQMTGLLIGLGLRSFSMQPSQLLTVKQEVLRSHAARLKPLAEAVLHADEPATLMGGLRAVRKAS